MHPPAVRVQRCPRSQARRRRPARPTAARCCTSRARRKHARTLARDTTSGALTQTSCQQYAPPQGADAVEDPDYYEDVEHRFTECTPAKALENVSEVVISRDGRAVYSAGYDLAAFQRDATSGALTQFGCAQVELGYRSCSPGRAVSGASALAASDDGRSLYMVSDSTNRSPSPARRSRNPRRRRRVPSPGRSAVRLSCPRVRSEGCAGVVRAGGARNARFQLRARATRSVRLRLSSHVTGSAQPPRTDLRAGRRPRRAAAHRADRAPRRRARPLTEHVKGHGRIASRVPRSGHDSSPQASAPSRKRRPDSPSANRLPSSSAGGHRPHDGASRTSEALVLTGR